jgi:hypothetical protein
LCQPFAIFLIRRNILRRRIQDMETLKQRLLAIGSVFVIVSAFAFTPPIIVQGETPKDMRVVNTAAEPVPTTIQGTANIQGTIQAAQAGFWNVGILGMPTVRIDPNQTLKVGGGGTQLLLNDSFNSFPEDTDTHIDSIDISPFQKVRFSGTINGSGDITYRVYSGPVVGGPHTGLRRLDVFTTNDAFTKVYEVAGLALHISINPESSNNQSILTVYGH